MRYKYRERTATTRVDKWYQLSLPRDMCRQMGIKPGDTLYFVDSAVGFTLTPDKEYAEALEAKNQARKREAG